MRSYISQRKRLTAKKSAKDISDANIARLRASLNQQYEEAIQTTERFASGNYKRSNTYKFYPSSNTQPFQSRFESVSPNDTSFLSRFSIHSPVKSPYLSRAYEMEQSARRDDSNQRIEKSYYDNQKSYIISKPYSIRQNLDNIPRHRKYETDMPSDSSQSNRRKQYLYKNPEINRNAAFYYVDGFGDEVSNESSSSLNQSIQKLHDEIETSIRKYPYSKTASIQDDSSVSDDLFSQHEDNDNDNEIENENINENPQKTRKGILNSNGNNGLNNYKDNDDMNLSTSSSAFDDRPEKILKRMTNHKILSVSSSSDDSTPLNDSNLKEENQDSSIDEKNEEQPNQLRNIDQNSKLNKNQQLNTKQNEQKQINSTSKQTTKQLDNSSKQDQQNISKSEKPQSTSPSNQNKQKDQQQNKSIDQRRMDLIDQTLQMILQTGKEFHEKTSRIYQTLEEKEKEINQFSVVDYEEEEEEEEEQQKAINNKESKPEKDNTIQKPPVVQSKNTEQVENNQEQQQNIAKPINNKPNPKNNESKQTQSIKSENVSTTNQDDSVSNEVPEIIHELIEEQPEPLRLEQKHGLKPLCAVQQAIKDNDTKKKQEEDVKQNQENTESNNESEMNTSGFMLISSAEERQRMLEERIRADNELLREMELFALEAKNMTFDSYSSGDEHNKKQTQQSNTSSSDEENTKTQSGNSEHEDDTDGIEQPIKGDNVTLKDEEEEESLSQIIVGKKYEEEEEEEEKNNSQNGNFLQLQQDNTINPDYEIPYDAQYALLSESSYVSDKENENAVEGSQEVIFESDEKFSQNNVPLLSPEKVHSPEKHKTTKEANENVKNNNNELEEYIIEEEEEEYNDYSAVEYDGDDDQEPMNNETTKEKESKNNGESPISNDHKADARYDNEYEEDEDDVNSHSNIPQNIKTSIKGQENQQESLDNDDKIIDLLNDKVQQLNEYKNSIIEEEEDDDDLLASNDEISETSSDSEIEDHAISIAISSQPIFEHPVDSSVNYLINVADNIMNDILDTILS